MEPEVAGSSPAAREGVAQSAEYRYMFLHPSSPDRFLEPGRRECGRGLQVAGSSPAGSIPVLVAPPGP